MDLWIFKVIIDCRLIVCQRWLQLHLKSYGHKRENTIKVTMAVDWQFEPWIQAELWSNQLLCLVRPCGQVWTDTYVCEQEQGAVWAVDEFWRKSSSLFVRKSALRQKFNLFPYLVSLLRLLMAARALLWQYFFDWILLLDSIQPQWRSRTIIISR